MKNQANMKTEQQNVRLNIIELKCKFTKASKYTTREQKARFKTNKTKRTDFYCSAAWFFNDLLCFAAQPKEQNMAVITVLHFPVVKWQESKNTAGFTESFMKYQIKQISQMLYILPADYERRYKKYHFVKMLFGSHGDGKNPSYNLVLESFFFFYLTGEFFGGDFFSP